MWRVFHHNNVWLCVFFSYRFINDVEDDNDISDENDYNTRSRTFCVYIVRMHTQTQCIWKNCIHDNQRFTHRKKILPTQHSDHCAARSNLPCRHTATEIDTVPCFRWTREIGKLTDIPCASAVRKLNVVY